MDLRDIPLERPLVFFDLETTGLNVVTDRVVQFAGARYEPHGGSPEERTYFVNPGRPIPAEVIAVHGITDQRVAGEPTFAQIAEELHAFVGDADLAGYNLARFDVPVLMEEFARAGIRFRTDGRSVVDVQEIFYKMEPRTLAGALRFYRGEELEGAHDALADVRATVRVLEGQLDRYRGADYTDRGGRTHAAPVRPDVAALHAFTQRAGQLDAANRLRRDDGGEPVFNFGKHKGRRLRDVFRKEKSYYHWIQDRDFSVQVKEIAREVWEAL